MPLAFKSLTHGTVAFGFFNIDSDMLLLERYFFFATDFCNWISRIARDEQNPSINVRWPVYCIEDASAIGNLMGAIHGTHFSGFIGEVYKKFPFPEQPGDFKQKPDGYRTRPIITEIIQRYATKTEIPFKAEKRENFVSISGIMFTKQVFHMLIAYVWRGGYPRWRDEIKPDYVNEMKIALEESNSWLFRDLVLTQS